SRACSGWRAVGLDEGTEQAAAWPGGWRQSEHTRAQALRRQTAAYGAYEGGKARLEGQLRRMQQWEERGYGQGRKKKKTKDVKKAIGGRIERPGPVQKPYEPCDPPPHLPPPPPPPPH